MELSSFFVFGILAIFETGALVPILKNGTFGVPFVQDVNSSVEYIIEFNGEKSYKPPIVRIGSAKVTEQTPLLVVIRQPKQVLSWQIPLMVDSDDIDVPFLETSRILCYDVIQARNKTLLERANYENPIISISTASNVSIGFNLTVDTVDEFFVEPSKYYQLQVTPSQPKYYFYNFSTNISKSGVNFDTVKLEIFSNDSICTTVSIQNASCPVLDLNHEITYSGFYETINTKGGITIPKDKFPHGFFIVFVAKGSDYDCTGQQGYVSKDRTKAITFSVKPSISYSDYEAAVFTTMGIILSFYVFFGLTFYLWLNKGYRSNSRLLLSVDDRPGPSNEENKISTAEEGQINDQKVEAESNDLLRSGSSNDTDYDFVADVLSDHEVVLNKSVIYVSDLARNDPTILKQKSNLYLYNVLTVAVFYGLPVVQLVITYQKVLNETGQQDLCYYNFLCAHPWGFLSDFNHLFSNVGYVLFGILFIWITYLRERSHVNCDHNGEYGIPQHYGMFYAMGCALIMEGVLSGSYHICPSHTNFQFDSSFMYVIAILCMVKLYQNRHPDINANAWTTFGVIAAAILLEMIGIFEPNIIFISLFTVLHLVACLYLTANIYYMGHFRLDKVWFRIKYQLWNYEYHTGYYNFLQPKYKARMILLILGNVCNILLAISAFFDSYVDFAMHLLLIFMANTALYLIFYGTMKYIHGERINLITWVFLLLSTLCAVSAMYFFWHKTISWALTPAQSRQLNQACRLLKFYDNHDIWHFLSAIGMFFAFMVLLTLDDDIAQKHRGSINVF